MAATVLYRSAEWDTPWWVRPNRAPGRFHRAGQGPTQYLSDHPLTVFAERLRSLGPAVVEDLDTVRWRVWAAKVDLAELVVADFASCEELGITADELVGDDREPCQALADRLRAAGAPGLVAPSAALAGTRTVVLFATVLASPYLLDPIDPTLDVPTAHVAERSMVPEEVVPLVRWPGRPHAELEAWRAGESFALLEPTPARG